MPRSRQRVTLEAGLRLNLNRLVRRGFIQRGGFKSTGISWTDSYSGELIAAGTVTADMSDTYAGWLRIDIGNLTQRIHLRSRDRNFGGVQWYFVCPRTGILASVVWMPPGASTFASRKAWGRQVAYQSQFLDAVGRAHLGKDRLNRRLCSIGGLDPDEWEFPPKPIWMRWETYNHLEKKFDAYEEALDQGTMALVAKFIAR